MRYTDIIVVGGGLVGSAIAYGLARCGAQVTVLDGADDVLRASRGNFGLVWVQGKGHGFSPYARWSRNSAQLWPVLHGQLLELTGIDVRLRQSGGFSFCYTEELFVQRRARLESIRSALAGDYPFEMLDHAALKARLPQVGPGVFGASYCPMDGDVNPLKLLRALHGACSRMNVATFTNQMITSISHRLGLFTLQTRSGTVQAPRIVLAAGLGNPVLAAQVGLQAPVRPQRGQMLVSERTARFLDYPTLHVRQTEEGSVQIGDSIEEVGFNDFTTNDVLARIARRAIEAFPQLAGLNLVRAWGALRVLSLDGYPVYQESPSCPGAFVATCHSGVTLSAIHAHCIAPWMAGGPPPDGLDVFSGERFKTPLSAAVLPH